MSTKSEPKTNRELRNFALVMTSCLAVIGGLLLWRHKPAAPSLLGLAAAFLLAGLLFPKVLRPIEWAWMGLAHVLGIVMTHVVLTLTFFLVITPIGLLLRVLSKRPLNLRFEKARSSYWEPVDAEGPCGRPDKPY